jgi:hypothetical protein
MRKVSDSVVVDRFSFTFGVVYAEDDFANLRTVLNGAKLFSPRLCCLRCQVVALSLPIGED